jgi:hypothetical protein
MCARIERLAIGTVAGFIAVSAAAGAAGLIGGGLSFPPEWLEGTPFSTYIGPGIILGVAVGGSALAAAVLVLRGHPSALPAAFVAGAIQAGWIVGEVLLVGTYGAVMLWLQVIYGVAGALLAALAYDASRRGGRTAPDHGPTPRGVGPWSGGDVPRAPGASPTRGGRWRGVPAADAPAPASPARSAPPGGRADTRTDLAPPPCGPPRRAPRGTEACARRRRARGDGAVTARGEEPGR